MRPALLLAALLSPMAASAAQAPAPSPVTPILYLRVRPEAWDFFRAGVGDGRYTFVGVHARAGFTRQLSRWSWRAELGGASLLGLPENAVAPAPRGQLGLGGSYWAANDSARNVAGVFLRQGFVRFGAPPTRGGHALRVGRWEFSDGAETAPSENATVAAVKRDRVAQRLIGPFIFSHVMRSFDGAHYTFDRRGRNATLLVSRVTRGAFDVKGWDELDVTLGYGSFTFPVRTARTWGDVRLFAARYDDGRGVLKTDNRSLAARQGDSPKLAVNTLGGHLIEAIHTSAGEVDVLLWGALQSGDWGNQSQAAHAELAEIGWQPSRGFGSLRPWLRTGWYRASGDDDPADGTHGTFFTMVPTPRPFARLPFYTPMNLQDVFVSLLLRPRPTVTARFDLRRLRLDQSADLWYAGGGAFEPQTFGYSSRPSNGARALATLGDVSVDWRVRPRWTLTTYLAQAAGGDVVDRTFPQQGRGRLGYVEVVYNR